MIKDLIIFLFFDLVFDYSDFLIYILINQHPKGAELMYDDMLEEELNKIIETSNNNILITDQDGIILYSNPKLWEIYGMESDSYIGTSVYQLESEGLLTPSINAIVLKEKKRSV